MSASAVTIPEKLFFKIGEVCELAGVQAHVLRYWESEFPMLAPQKNRAGQRVYRKRDVEMALRIKDLLYEDQYTIAGAKKRLAAEMRGGKLKVVSADEDQNYSAALPQSLQDSGSNISVVDHLNNGSSTTQLDRQALRRLAAELRELLVLLEKETQAASKKSS